MESIPNKDNLSFKSASKLIWGDTIQKVDKDQDNVSISSLDTLVWEDTLDPIDNLTTCAVTIIIEKEDFDREIKDYDFVDSVNIEGETILSSSSFDNIDRFQQSFDCRDLPFQGRRKSSRVPSLPHIQLTDLFWYI